nr:nucleoplasmin-2 [Oryctolagus cuniculus]
MNRSSISSTAEKAVRTLLWGCELNQEKRTWTWKPQVEGKESCRLWLNTVAMADLELSPSITFQLRAGSGPVFISGKECYETLDPAWEEEEEGEEEEVEEEEDEDYDDEEEEADISLEESPVKPAKRQAPLKQSSVAKKKKLAKEEEAVRSSLREKSPGHKAKSTPRPKKPASKK